jgi:chorismate mutase/prephenate dehydratase
MDSIAALRKKIDALDQDIMNQLDKRFDLSVKIGQLKQLENKVVFDSNREQLILDKTSSLSHSPQIQEVYRTIMTQSKSIQRK